MTTPSHPSHRAAPSAREIAEFTTRLREISARGRNVDPAERAAFLADKHALINRITDTDTDTARADTAGLGPAGDTARAQPPGRAVTFDQAVYYSDAELAAIAGAVAAGDTARAQHLQDRPWLAQGVTVDAAHADIADRERSVAPMSSYSLAQAEQQQQERREQLGRWHDDDHATDTDNDLAAEGQQWVLDDGPGLP